MSWSPHIPAALGDDGEWVMNDTVVEAINQNLRMIILTAPGERTGFPNFGAGLKLYLFETPSQSLYDRISSAIRSQVGRYIPVITIEEINFNIENMDSHQLHIQLKYSMPGFGIHFLEITT